MTPKIDISSLHCPPHPAPLPIWPPSPDPPSLGPPSPDPPHLPPSPGSPSPDPPHPAPPHLVLGGPPAPCQLPCPLGHSPLPPTCWRGLRRSALVTVGITRTHSCHLACDQLPPQQQASGGQRRSSQSPGPACRQPLPRGQACGTHSVGKGHLRGRGAPALGRASTARLDPHPQKGGEACLERSPEPPAASACPGRVPSRAGRVATAAEQRPRHEPGTRCSISACGTQSDTPGSSPRDRGQYPRLRIWARAALGNERRAVIYGHRSLSFPEGDTNLGTPAEGVWDTA